MGILGGPLTELEKFRAQYEYVSRTLLSQIPMCSRGEGLAKKLDFTWNRTKYLLFYQYKPPQLRHWLMLMLLPGVCMYVCMYYEYVGCTITCICTYIVGITYEYMLPTLRVKTTSTMTTTMANDAMRRTTSCEI